MCRSIPSAKWAWAEAGGGLGRCRAGVGIEMLEGARLNAGPVDKNVDVGGFEADHPSHAIGGKVALVDEAVEGSGGDPETPGRFLGG